MYNRPIVPDNFLVPVEYNTSNFILKPLSIHHLVRDYEAVMSSVERLKGLMDDSGWPEGLTIKENLIDLGWHEREFTLRHSFAYTVLSLNETMCLGCCYIYPDDNSIDKINAFYWIREEYLKDGYEDELGLVFRKWLENDWPFKYINFPGRD